MEFLTLKYIHIVSSTILFGTGIGSAFYMFMANRRKINAEIYFATRHVEIADWLFTTPSVIVQFLSGIALMHIGNYSLTNKWIIIGLTLYFFAGMCWLPVVWIQIKMRKMAKAALESNGELPKRYWTFEKWWIMLGSLAFPSILIVFYLMVFKPS